MLGALIKITNLIPIESIENLVKKKFTEKIGEEKTQATVNAIHQAYEKVV
jgi:Pyruvate/2-oxoacid:ferredoxin oxidoreductase gamma subunit